MGLGVSWLRFAFFESGLNMGERMFSGNVFTGRTSRFGETNTREHGTSFARKGGGRQTNHVEVAAVRPRQGRMAAKNGSWFFSSHGRTALLHIITVGGRRRAAALSAGHPRMPGHWTMLDEAKLCNQEDPRRHSGGCGGAQRSVELAWDGEYSVLIQESHRQEGRRWHAGFVP
eukprot:s5809_g6.t1